MKIKNFKKFISLFSLLILFSFLAVGCTNEKEKETKGNALVIGASPNPHVLIVEKAIEEINEHPEKYQYTDENGEKHTLEVEVKSFSDYIIPNMALNEKSLDLNYFQHEPYLKNFNEEHGLDLVSIGKIHIEPMGVYSKKITSLDQLKDDDVISIPNDPTNMGRALIVLEDQKVIKLKDDIDKTTATQNDIVDNPKNIEIKPLEAPTLARALDEVAASVINTNFALDSGLDLNKDRIAMESKDSPYANVVAARKDNKDDEKVKLFMKAITSDKVRDFINDTYDGEIIPSF